MIFVPRPPLAPDALRSKAARAARGRASRFYGRPEEERRRLRHRFDRRVYASAEVQRALGEVFQRKCAYCESPPGSTQAQFVDHFRPTDGALGLDGTFASDHYWWLAYEWENLYLVCPDCAQMKGGRFPVAGERARPRVKGPKLKDERRLLLDPCADDPEAHLVYAIDGYVSSGTTEGRTTIDVLSLNRWWLVAARKRELERAREEWDEIGALVEEDGQKSAATTLDRFVASTHPYAGIRRQFARQWLSEAGCDSADLLGQVVEGAAGKVAVIDARQRKRTREDFEDHEEDVKSYAVGGEGFDRDHYYRATRTIARVEIENFRIIERLDVEFPDPRGAEVPWLMLLGENGSGKSSVLQATALALMGEEYRERIGLDPRRVLRHGASGGSVTVHLKGLADPVQMTFTSRSRKFHCGPSEPKLLLLGYGATRLLPRAGPGSPRDQAAPPSDFANVDSLFDPHAALRDPVPWLVSLSDERFDVVARALKGLLPLAESDQLVRSKKRGIEVEAFGARLSLDQLSDGYQSILALATDMMQVLMRRWEAIEPAEGIVVIDELGTHLHPRWRMQIVSGLRSAFPRLQFLTTSHDPLCLRGLRDGEAMVVRRSPNHEVFALRDLPSLEGMRVDQLLTSEIFGLNSTSDPETDRLLDEYRDLRWYGGESAAVRARREELRTTLDRRQVLGRDRRERLMLEAADEYLAAEAANPDAEQRRALKKQTKSRIAEIFAEAVPEEARRG